MVQAERVVCRGGATPVKSGGDFDDIFIACIIPVFTQAFGGMTGESSAILPISNHSPPPP